MSSVKLWSVRKECLRHKWLFLTNCAIAVAIAWILTDLSHHSYDVQRKISIDASEDKVFKRTDAFSSITQKLGMKEGNLTTDPWLYRNILESSTFRMELGNIIVSKKDGTSPKTFAQYLLQDYQQPWWTRFTGKEELPELIDENVKCEVNMHNGVITIQTSAQDPHIAFTLLDSVCTRLQTYLTDYSRRKAEIDLGNRSRELSQSKAKYEKAMKAYSRFVDSHTDIFEPSVQLEESLLQQKVDNALAEYNNSIQQYKLAEMHVQRTIPYFITLVNETYPQQPSHPKRLVNIAVWLFYTFFITLWIVLIRHKIKLRKKGETDELRQQI